MYADVEIYNGKRKCAEVQQIVDVRQHCLHNTYFKMYLSCQTLLSLIPAGSDFNVTVFDFSFVGGGAPEIIAAAQLPAIDDTLPELTEGFLYYLEVVNSQLHPRDVGRIDFFNKFTLVRIQDDDCELS